MSRNVGRAGAGREVRGIILERSKIGLIRRIRRVCRAGEARIIVLVLYGRRLLHYRRRIATGGGVHGVLLTKNTPIEGWRICRYRNESVASSRTRSVGISCAESLVVKAYCFGQHRDSITIDQAHHILLLIKDFTLRLLFVAVHCC